MAKYKAATPKPKLKDLIFFMNEYIANKRRAISANKVFGKKELAKQQEIEAKNLEQIREKLLGIGEQKEEYRASTYMKIQTNVRKANPGEDPHYIDESGTGYILGEGEDEIELTIGDS